MSPQHALQDPVFRAYVLIVLATLATGGLVLALVQLLTKQNISRTWQTYRAWLWMAPLWLALIFAGRAAFIIGVTLVALLAFREFARASGLHGDRWMSAAVYAGIAAIGAASLMSHVRWFGAVSLFAAALILIIPVLRNRFRGELQRMSLGVVAFIYVGWMFGHLGVLANSRNAYGYLCFIIFATAVCDVSAFTFGRLFGGPALRSEISPRKTWGGALGALAVAMLLPWLLRFSLPEFGTVQLLLAGLIVGVGGQLGDLSISVVKRDLGIKDMGASIPGHGGILDRIDSLIYVAPLFVHIWLL